MKTKICTILIVVSSLSAFLSSCSSGDKKVTSSEQTANEAAYICPMDPEITSDRPGKCSKCNMDLVEKTANIKK